MQFLDARRGKGSWDSDTWMQYGAFLRALVLGCLVSTNNNVFCEALFSRACSIMEAKGSWGLGVAAGRGQNKVATCTSRLRE